MRALIVVESAFGNTASIAEAIASALTEKGAEANVAPADRAPSDPRGYGLVLVGAPTHNRGLPTPSTRRTARKKGAAVPDAGVLEWIAGLDPEALATSRVLAFDTVIKRHSVMAGSAAKSAVRKLGRRGVPAECGESFLIASGAQALKPGEMERAADWAATLI